MGDEDKRNCTGAVRVLLALKYLAVGVSVHTYCRLEQWLHVLEGQRGKGNESATQAFPTRVESNSP